MTTLNQALETRFTDQDEINDVANYGCAAGVCDFIYSTELCEFYDAHGEEIDDLMQMLEVTINDLVFDPGCWTFQEIKEKSVWIAVEDFCTSRALEFA